MAPHVRRRLAAAATAAVPALWALAAATATAAAAEAVPPVVRMRPIDIWGTYTTTHDETGGGCPPNFTLGQGEPFSAADGISDRPPHADVALNFLGAALSEGGVSCSAGALVAVKSIETFNPNIMKGVGKPNGTGLLWANAFSVRMLFWADVVGLGVSTIPCGASTSRWGNDTWVAFGELDWSLLRDVPGGKERISVGGTNRTAVFLTPSRVSCIMDAPPRRGLARPPPPPARGDGVGDDVGGDAAGTPATAGDGGQRTAVSAGAAAGIGAAAAAVGLALGVVGGLSASGCRRRRRRRRPLHSSPPVEHRLPATDAAGGRPAAPPPPPSMSRPPLPRAGGPPAPPPVVGLVLPTFGEPNGPPPAAAAASALAAKDLREAFGLADAPPMPPELADSMAPPPMPDALRGSTISDPSTGARSGRS